MLRFYRTIYRRGFQESPWRNQWWGIVLSRSGVEHPPNRMKYEMVGFPSYSAARIVRHWFYHLGGAGLILLGLLDSSAIPVPGSMDALTIVLSAHARQWWPYYAFMATAGSVIGGYLT